VRSRARREAVAAGHAAARSRNDAAFPSHVTSPAGPTALQQLIGFRSFHQYSQRGGSLWQIDYEELADHLKL
jgi:hypothetical protein